MKYSEESKRLAIEDYRSGKSAREVSAKHGMDHSTVIRMARASGEKIRSNSDGRREYSVDASFFRSIDTHEKAQILGFIYADGCIGMKSATSGNLQIVLNARDKDYLEWIRTTMKNERPVYETNYLNKKDGKHRHNAWYVSSHPQIIRDLNLLGVTPRKSLTIGFPTFDQVPREFMGSFILGVFEGDGCIYLGRCRKGPTYHASVSVMGSVPFCTGLQAFLRTCNIESDMRTKPTKQDVPIAWIAITSVASIMRFYELAYGHVTFRMNRKHDKFLLYKACYNEVEREWDGEVFKTWELIKRKDFTPENKARMRDMAHQNGYDKARPMVIKSPRGVLHESDMVKPFCREYGLTSKHIYRLLDQKVEYHKGWTRPTDSEIAIARANGTLVQKVYRQTADTPADILPLPAAQVQPPEQSAAA